LGVLVLVVLGACSGAGSPGRSAPSGSTAPLAEDTTPVTVRVGHVAAPAYAPLYVALGRGYFDRLHVKVDLIPVRGGQDPIDLVSRGELDALVNDLSAPMFNALARGQKFRVAGSMAVIPADGIPLSLVVSRKLLDAGKVRTLADL